MEYSFHAQVLSNHTWLYFWDDFAKPLKKEAGCWERLPCNQRDLGLHHLDLGEKSRVGGWVNHQGPMVISSTYVMKPHKMPQSERNSENFIGPLPTYLFVLVSFVINDNKLATTRKLFSEFCESFQQIT